MTMTPPAAPECRIWILEDHHAIRQLLTEFVLVQPGLKVVGAGGDHAALVQACAAGQVDLVLLDLMLDGCGGLNVLERLGQGTGRPKVVIFSAVVTLHTVHAALHWGVSGYVEKAAPLEELQAAIARVAGGGVYFSERVSSIARTLVEGRGHRRSAVALTPRELNVLAMIARGMNAKLLAEHLSLSEPAIYKIKKTIAEKLQTNSDQELTLTALRMGLIGSFEAPLSGASGANPGKTP